MPADLMHPDTRRASLRPFTDLLGAALAAGAGALPDADPVAEAQRLAALQASQLAQAPGGSRPDQPQSLLSLFPSG